MRYKRNVGMYRENENSERRIAHRFWSHKNDVRKRRLTINFSLSCSLFLPLFFIFNYFFVTLQSVRAIIASAEAPSESYW